MELSGEDSGRGVFFFFHASKLSQHGMKRVLTTKFSICTLRTSSSRSLSGRC
jgi:hypothetical protein